MHCMHGTSPNSCVHLNVLANKQLSILVNPRQPIQKPASVINVQVFMSSQQALPQIVRIKYPHFKEKRCNRRKRLRNILSNRFLRALSTLPLTINETQKWLSSLSTLMQKPFWWWQYNYCQEQFPITSWGFRSPPVPLRRQLGVKQA